LDYPTGVLLLQAGVNGILGAASSLGGGYLYIYIYIYIDRYIDIYIYIYTHSPFIYGEYSP